MLRFGSLRVLDEPDPEIRGHVCSILELTYSPTVSHFGQILPAIAGVSLWLLAHLMRPPVVSFSFSKHLSVMVHAKSLRVIGQVLEPAKVTVFELEKHGANYVLWSDSLTQANELILRHGLTEDVINAGARQAKNDCSLCFSSFDISRLDSQARKHRRDRSSSYINGSNKLSRLLRTLGDQLDQNSVNAFHFSWTPESVSILTLPTAGLTLERTTLTAEKLLQLSFQRRLRRSSPHLLRLVR